MNDRSSIGEHEYECDHPLSTYESSKWNDHSHSVGLMNEIEKDVCRTHPDINFYHEYQSFGVENQKKLQRILFLFAKSHPEISYVQGMNDICGTLLYVFGTDENKLMQQYAEADAYYCFEYLINVHQGIDLFFFLQFFYYEFANSLLPHYILSSQLVLIFVINTMLFDSIFNY